MAGSSGREARILVCLSLTCDLYPPVCFSGNTGKGLFHIRIKSLAQSGQDLSSGTGTAIMAV